MRARGVRAVAFAILVVTIQGRPVSNVLADEGQSVQSVQVPTETETRSEQDRRVDSINKLLSVDFPQQELTFARVRYSSPGARRTWMVDFPDADLGFSLRLSQWTNLKVSINPEVVSLTDDLSEYPILYMVGGHISFTEAEVKGLREYLEKGGFLMVDDFHGEEEWANLRREIQRVFPHLAPVDLPLTDPIFQFPFRFTAKPQVCSIAMAMQHRGTGATWDRADGKTVHYWGLKNQSGKLMAVFCHNTDLGDGWERGDDHPWYRKAFSEKLAYPMGINIFSHVLSGQKERD